MRNNRVLQQLAVPASQNGDKPSRLDRSFFIQDSLSRPAQLIGPLLSRRSHRGRSEPLRGASSFDLGKTHKT